MERVSDHVFAESIDEAETAIEAYFELLKSYSAVLGDGQSPESHINADIWDEGANQDMDFEEEPTLREIEGRSRDFTIQW